MYVLQHYSSGTFTFTPFAYVSEMLQHVRSNYGLTESEFCEFMVKNTFEREPFTLMWFEGEVPQMTAMKGAKDMGAAFRAAISKK